MLDTEVGEYVVDVCVDVDRRKTIHWERGVVLDNLHPLCRVGLVCVYLRAAQCGPRHRVEGADAVFQLLVLEIIYPLGVFDVEYAGEGLARVTSHAEGAVLHTAVVYHLRGQHSAQVFAVLGGIVAEAEQLTVVVGGRHGELHRASERDVGEAKLLVFRLE